MTTGKDAGNGLESVIGPAAGKNTLRLKYGGLKYSP
jgi:hypothetical protein